MEIREDDEASTRSSSDETIKKRHGDWRKQDNGECNAKPNHENYFNIYYGRTEA